jgi:colanic acid biosynthesis glycosyl transferase WcaI
VRIGMVTQWYDPEGGSAMTFGVIARALHALGHEVDVLTGFPNYPSGRLAEGYRLRPYQREVRDGVTVHRAPLYVSHDANPVRRAGNYLSFGASAAALASKALGRSDAVLVVPSPPFTAGAGLVLKHLRGIPFGLQIQDLWPQSVTASGMISGGTVGRAEKALHRVMDRLYAEADFIAVTSPGMADVIAARGVPRDKLTFVSNWANEAAFHPVETPAEVGLPARRPFTVMYAGAMGEVQGLDVVLGAAELVRDHTDIGFLLVGGGVAKAGLVDEVRRRGLDNVTFADAQPVERMADVLGSAQVQLISLADLPVFASTLPSKLPATLATGRPIIGAVGGDARRLIEESGAGWAIPPGDPRALADAVLAARGLDAGELAAKGQAGRSYYLDHLSEAVGAARLVELLAQAAETAAGRRRSESRRRRRTASATPATPAVPLSQAGAGATPGGNPTSDRPDATGEEPDAAREAARVERIYTARGYDTDLEYADVNPVYLQRIQSMETATLAALRAAGLWDRLGELEILDYGCGNGRWLGRWLAWGASPQRLHGVDIRRAAIERARQTFPQCPLEVLDPDGALPLPDGAMDVVVANLVFSSILDDRVRAAAAAQIARVLKPGGVFLSCDFAIDNPKNPDVRAFRVQEAVDLFPGFTLEGQRRLILAPPLARALVPRSWGSADLLERIAPPVRTHRLLTLRKASRR